MGRLFSGHLLDMFEFGVSNYVPVTKFQVKEINYEIKPILLFQGEQFEFSPKHQRLKNFLIDFMKVQEYEEANIVELKRVIIFTSIDEKNIMFR